MSEILKVILLSALCGVLVFLWGVKKEKELPKELERELLIRARSTILGKLRKQREATMEEMCTWLNGLVVGPIWSNRRLKVTDPQKLLEVLLPLLVEQGDIEEIKREGRSFYRLKNRK